MYLLGRGIRKMRSDPRVARLSELVARSCKVCDHAHRSQIEDMLRSGISPLRISVWMRRIDPLERMSNG